MIKPTLEAVIELLDYLEDINPQSRAFEQLRQIVYDMKSKHQNCKISAITNGKQGAIIFNICIMLLFMY